MLETADIDVSSLRFGPGGASPAHAGHVKDVNKDGQRDLLVHFPIAATGLTTTDTTTGLTGITYDGRHIEGSDYLQAVTQEFNRGKGGK